MQQVIHVFYTRELQNRNEARNKGYHCDGLDQATTYRFFCAVLLTCPVPSERSSPSITLSNSQHNRKVHFFRNRPVLLIIPEDSKVMVKSRSLSRSSRLLRSWHHRISSQSFLTHGPNISGPLPSSSEKLVALGSRTPASAYTTSVSKPRGTRGFRTIATAPLIIAS